MNRSIGGLTTILLAGAAGRVLAQHDAAPAVYPHVTEPIGAVREIYDGVLTPDLAVRTFRNIDRLFPTRLIARAATPLPLPVAAVPLTTVRFTDQGKQYDLETYLELNRVAGLLVLDHGRVKLERYRFEIGRAHV